MDLLRMDGDVAARPDVASAVDRLVACYRRVAPVPADRHGVRYPVALEAAVLRSRPRAGVGPAEPLRPVP